MARRDSESRKKLAAVGGTIDDALPTEESENAYNEAFSKIPQEHHHLVHKVIGHGVSHGHKLFAAAAAAILVREEMQPNSAVTLLPQFSAAGVPWVPSATIAPGFVTPLVPYIGGVAQPQWNFVRGQRFFGIMTDRADVQNGWYIAANTLKFSIDAISGINMGDASFALFEEDVVLGRMILAEYIRHEIVESIPFTVSAVNYAAAAKVMLNGITLQYWDERCKNSKLVTGSFDVQTMESFSELVRDLAEMAGAGHPASRLLKRIRGFRG
jgi:hypothetical protein